MEYMAIPNITTEYIWGTDISGLHTEVIGSYCHKRRLYEEEVYDEEEVYAIHGYKIFYENRDIFITESVDKYYAI